MMVMMLMMVLMPMFVFMAFALMVMMMVFVYHGVLCFLLQRYTTPRATGLQLAVHAAVYGNDLAAHIG